MSLLDTTLVVRGDVAAAQADVLATGVTNAASTGELMIQVDGTFAAGDDSLAGKDAMIKLSVAVPQADGSNAVMGSAEFKRSQILSSEYKAPTTGANQVITISGLSTQQDNSIRIEAQDGINIHSVLGITGITAAEIVDRFKNRQDKSLFTNVSFAVSGSDVQITVTPRGHDIIVSGDDKLTVTYNTESATKRRGQRENIMRLEKNSHISAGAYNQVEFPVVVPATTTEFGADYGIYTIEVLQSLPGNRRAIETIRIAIKDDEAASNKLVNAIQTILGLSGVDVTPPSNLTSITFVTSLEVDTAITEIDKSDDDAIFVKAVGGEVGAKLKVTVTSSGSQADVTEEFTMTAVDESFELAISGADYDADDVLTLQAKVEDSDGNISGNAGSGDTATIIA